MLWLRHRMKRLQSKLRHLNTYLQTLSQANQIERLTDLTNCKQPVLILYGFGATRRSVSILESRLRHDGFDVISIRLGGLWDLFNTAPIDQLATMLSEKIEKLSKRYQLPRFSIIGYSKGGLIGRYYLSHLNGDKRVHTLITLATPHQGSPWSFLSGLFLVGLASKGIRQMIPFSKFMRGLAAKPVPKNVYAVSIYSDLDKMCPPKYSMLPIPAGETSSQNILLPQLHHSDFVIKRAAYRVIHEHLLAGIKQASSQSS